MPVFRTEGFSLASGEALAELEVAYECYGELAEDKSNAVLVAHGITSSHHAAGEPTADRRRGWWNEVIGPGKLLDTTRYFVVSSNALGSCYGTTGPASIDPATGKAYGAAFPDFTYEDIVQAQLLLLRNLGISRLVAVAGASLGGYQAFQWAVSVPDFMAGIIALDTAPKDTFDTAAVIPGLLKRFSQDPNWNGGNYYSTGSVEEALTDLRIRTLKSYGFEERLKDVANPKERERIVRETAREWAREFDPHSLVAMHRAWATFNAERDFDRIRCKVLYVLCDTDEWFPAHAAGDVLSNLSDAGVDTTFLEISSPHGHYATTEEPEKWVPTAAAFLRQLEGA